MISVLIVEDNYHLRRIYRKIFKSEGFQIFGAVSNGAKAVELYRNTSTKPDIIIMDYQMPIKDGIEASKDIFKINPRAKIIFASGNHMVKDLALSLGAVQFLLKPFNIYSLIEDIKNIIVDA